MIKLCPNCGENVSPKAHICPKCGTQLLAPSPPRKPPKRRSEGLLKVIIAISIGLFVAATGSGILFIGSNQKSNSVAETSATSDTAQAVMAEVEITAEAVPAATIIENAQNVEPTTISLEETQNSQENKEWDQQEVAWKNEEAAWQVQESAWQAEKEAWEAQKAAWKSLEGNVSKETKQTQESQTELHMEAQVETYAETLPEVQTAAYTESQTDDWKAIEETKRIAESEEAAKRVYEESVSQSIAQSISDEQTKQQSIMVWLPKSGNKYHNKPDCGNMDAKNAREVTLQKAQADGISPCKTCFGN